MQLSEGFDFCQKITGNTSIFTPKSRQWGEEIIQYSALIESLSIRVSQPSLGAPSPPPEGLEELGNLAGGEAYRSWLWAQPRRQLDIVKRGQVLASVAILNRVPFYVINLMPYLSSQSTARLGFGSSLDLRVVDVGFGPLSSQDDIVVFGEGVQEADVEDLDPQFSELEQTLSGLIRAQVTGLSHRLSNLEAWTIEQGPKIEALRSQGASNAIELAQAITDLSWIRRNWGAGGGDDGGTGGGESVAPLTSVPGAMSPNIPEAGKFRVLPPGTYRIRVSLGQELENQVPEEGAKTIELVSWSEEPNSTILSYGDETNRYNWNTSGVVKWEKDFPRSGGEVTVTSTEARKWFGLKVRNWNKPNYWGGLHNYYLDGAFVTEQALAGYSAEWVARGF